MDKNILKQLTEWIKCLMEEATKDSDLTVSWFQAPSEESSPIQIIGGWAKGFSEEYADLLYLSKSEPKYAMCIKIVLKDNFSTYLDRDFDSINMPVYKHGEVDDTCIPLELEDEPKQAAQFFLAELSRINRNYKAGLYLID